MGRRKTQPYLTSDEIYEEWRKWKSTGVVSDTFAKQMLMVGTHMMTMPAFNGYSQEVKEEMVQEGCLKIMKNLKNMKEEKRSGFFSYFTTCVWTSCMDYLRKHYKRMNNRRQFLLKVLECAKTRKINVSPDFIKNLKRTIEQYSEASNNNEVEEITHG